MKPQPYRRVARALVRLGFRPFRQKGSHVFFVHADGRRTTVARHGNRDIGRGTLSAICEQIDMTQEEFERQL
jgi:predicted RNA binding protein YcfA (HicA-like mRNA interferase family)